MLSKSQISFIRSLQQKKQRKEQGVFIAEGLKVVEELLHSAFRIEAVYYTPAAASLHQSAIKVLKNDHIQEISEADMERISALSTASPALAIVRIPEPQDFSLLDVASKELVMVLDEVKDPGNLGTIIRIADWFGIRHILCSEGSVDQYNPKTVQATMGSLSRVDVTFGSIEGLLANCPKTIPVYGALLEGENIYTEALQPNGILVMGSESHGIRPELRPYISHALHIPRFGGAESLNVAIATAIICSEFKRRSQ